MDKMIGLDVRSGFVVGPELSLALAVRVGI